MQRYEHKKERLTKYGCVDMAPEKEGWELVSVVQHLRDGLYSSGSAYWKRPRRSLEESA